MDIEVRGEKLTLCAERAAFWHRERALLIADPHWGKAATFRAGGIPVPSGTTSEAIERLESLLQKTDPARVIFLGDLLHAKPGRSKDMASFSMTRTSIKSRSSSRLQNHTVTRFSSSPSRGCSSVRWSRQLSRVQRDRSRFVQTRKQATGI